MDYRTTAFLLYMFFIVRAAFVSKQKVATIKWMAISLLTSWLIALYGTQVVAHYMHATGNIPAAAADFFTIPAFIVPAIVGTLHARRTRRDEAQEAEVKPD